MPRATRLDRVEPRSLVRDGKDGWLPHLSLAYYNTDNDNQALVDAIAPLRREVIADVQVEEIHLISTPADLIGANRWVWPLHARFELGRAGSGQKEGPSIWCSRLSVRVDAFQALL